MADFSSPNSSQKPSEPPPRSSTRLESVQEIRAALQAKRMLAAQEAAVSADTSAFRPVGRPPMALLCILDDGRDEGERLRLRGDRIVIGRSEGDILIPHDPMISARHAELSRRVEEGRSRWYLTDLQSMNGTYVRIGSAPLKHRQELLIGRGRYRFDDAPQGAVLSEPADSEKSGGTRGWQSVAPSEVLPSLVELTLKGEGPRILLSNPQNWIGRDPKACTVVRENDALLSPRHARIFRDRKGRWFVENNKSLNGTWMRIPEMSLDASCEFQLGEQRFRLRVL
jgi:pSer/pThr/pTyr-binding forkhead associated (FHA) protein